ncbi:MAG: hypothetical protein KKD63_03000 [Proteobacteria bacterium]|nr:hypothetical protein [Desulfobulbaceae bacterium]MBU4151828.1 hypothetical protein [Pseudomonadota bacterium]MDP2104929.1 hypothetical protein [Desulfobulbaceae bacterium]
MNRGLLNISCWRLKRVGGLLAVCAFFCLAATGCETLDSRLTRNKATLGALPETHQSLIRQGKIQIGFTPAEVYLAWGAPTHKSFTENAQGSIETWHYTNTQTETYYREERYFDRDYGRWRFIDRPYYQYFEYLYQEAMFTNGALSSFTLYPSALPYLRN